MHGLQSPPSVTCHYLLKQKVLARHRLSHKFTNSNTVLTNETAWWGQTQAHLHEWPLRIGFLSCGLLVGQEQGCREVRLEPLPHAA